jgi:type VI secretion system protein ImpM
MPNAWSVLGKHPSRADFVRVNVASDVAVEFHRWLESGVELLNRQRQPLSIEPARFLFSAGQSETVLLGVMMASVDSVGRAFPLAAFLELPADDLPSNLSALPFFASEALEAVQTYLRAKATSKEPLDLHSVPLPPQDEAEAALTRATQALVSVTVGALHDVVSVAPAIGGAWYSVKTLLLACDRPRKMLKDAPTLECPLSPEFGAAAWLSILEKGNPGPPSPSLVWNASRLYVGLGPLPAGIFLGLTGAAVQSTKVWPATTSQQAAIDSSRASLRAAPLLANRDSSLIEALSGLGARR